MNVNSVNFELRTDDWLVSWFIKDKILKTYWELEVLQHAFFIRLLCRGTWSCLRPRCFPSGWRAVSSRWVQGWPNIGACKWHAGKRKVLATRIRTRGLTGLWKIKALTPCLLINSYWCYPAVKFRGNLQSKDSKRDTRASAHSPWALNCTSLKKNSDALVAGNA